MSNFQISDINFWEKIDSLRNALNRKKTRKNGTAYFSGKMDIFVDFDVHFVYSMSA